MFANYYYHGVLRKYVIIFGNLFNDIDIQRFNNAGQRIQTIRVPIAYGPKEKFLVRISQDPNLDKAVAIQLPRIGFEMTGMTYAGNRALSSITRNVTKQSNNDNNRLLTQYTPAPYDINFRLSIFVTNADDGVQIIEQILPYFKPEWTITANLIPTMNLRMDVPVVLNSVNLEDTYEGDFNTRRALIWNLDFTMKGYIYGPTSSAGIIKRAQADITNSELLQSRVARVLVTPGLLANGAPTTDSSQSVDFSQISADDNYGIATDIFNFTDGLNYNPRTGQDE